MSRRLAGLTIALAGLLGCAVLFAPLWPTETAAGAATRTAAAPALMGGIVLLCFAAAALEAGVGLGPKAVALLGALVAFNSVLRFVEVIIPGPGEFSPIFALVLLAGYAYGARFGYLTGALTLAVSALITGGVGPWLPYQMLAAGWVGLTAGWLPRARRGLRATRGEIAGLAAFGALWGIGYGIVLTLWDWQYREIGAAVLAGPASLPGDAFKRFALFYVATSLPFDLFRAAGNAALVAVAGGPTLTLLRRLGRPFGSSGSGHVDLPIRPGSAELQLGPGDSPESRASDACGPPRRRGAPSRRAFARLSSPAVAGEDPRIEVRYLRPRERQQRGRILSPATAGERWTRRRRGRIGGLPGGPYVSESPGPSWSSALPGTCDPALLPEVDAVAPSSDAAPTPWPPNHHPHAWLAWLVAAIALGSVTRNPLVLAEAWLAVAVVRASAARNGLGKAWPIGRLAPWVIVSTTVYNGLMAHAGDTVLARLPAGWPLIGGSVTLEALIQGAANGLALILLVAAFSAFESALPTRALLTLVPRAFGSVALVAAVALTGVPSVRRQLAEVREALAVHGHTAGLRGWIAAAVPTLSGGLERAVRLAESLTARGLVAAAPPPPAARAAIGGGLGAVLIGGTGLLAAPDARWTVVAATGLVGSIAGLALAGRGQRRTSWRPAPWRHGDTLLTLSSAAVLGLAAWPAARTVLAYTPYPAATWPPIDLGVVCGVALLALPGWGLFRESVMRTAKVPVTRFATPPQAPSRRALARLSSPAVAGEDDPIASDAPPVSNAASAWTRPTRSHPFPCDSGGKVAAPLALTDRGPVHFTAFGVRYPPAGERDGDPPALEGIDAAMGGGITLLAGPSGAGKSTLLRALNGLVPHFTGGHVTGRVRVGGLDPVSLGPAVMSRLVGFVGDAPEAAFAVDQVDDEVAFALEQRGRPAAGIAAAVRAALAAAHVTPLAQRRVDTLSGGEAQRVALAAALALSPAVLALDEPTSQLDDANAAAVLAAVRGLADAGTTVVLSEHRLERVVGVADRMIWLPGHGAPAVVGRPADVLARIALPEPPRVPNLTSTDAHSAAPAALAFRSVTFGYDGPLLSDLSLSVAAGELVVLMAPSGAGKTTLLRLAAGLARPTAGSILVAGRDIDGEPPHSVCRRLAYVPQAAGALLVGATVAEAVARGAAIAGAAAIAERLEQLGVDHLTGRHPADLSAGERQRVALGLALAGKRPAAALDEPTRGLDAWALARLADVLHRRCADGMGVLVATHDRRLAGAAHRVVELGGRSHPFGVIGPGRSWV